MPTYPFFRSRQNGMIVFSYTSECGAFKNDEASSPTCCASSIVISSACLPRIGVPSLSAKLNVKNALSVSPYTVSALVFTTPYLLVWHSAFPYVSSTTRLAYRSSFLPVAVVDAATSIS